MSLVVRFTSLWRAAAGCALALALANAQQAQAQLVRQAVGGVSIDATGAAHNVQEADLEALRQERAKAMQPVPGDLQGRAQRKISLRRLEAALADHRTSGKPLSDELRYLAGMQRVEYVFVYPEQNDIVLAGSGEGWKLNAVGEVVGITTGHPVLLLDDLLVALRSIENTRASGITCSIDPTADGIVRLQAMVKRLQPANGDISPVLSAIEESLGPQKITVGGVPVTSHFARVLVAADYRMKRLAMGFDPSPVAALPSFMQMLKNSGKQPKTMLPRWWLAPEYEALLTAEDGLSWELPAGSVAAQTEEEFVSVTGQRQGSGKANPLAKKWADSMTAHYDELAEHEPIFGQLRNCMNLAVVAALISEHHLTDKCGWNMPLLMNPELATESYNAASSVDSQASALQRGTTWIISASGGIQINPWASIEKPRDSAALSTARAKGAAPGATWWWN